MSKKIICPNCGSDDLRCNATISAVLETKTVGDGSQDFEFCEWSNIKNINWFECKECDFYFEGDEDEFIESLESEEDDAKVS